MRMRFQFACIGFALFAASVTVPAAAAQSALPQQAPLPGSQPSPAQPSSSSKQAGSQQPQQQSAQQSVQQLTQQASAQPAIENPNRRRIDRIVAVVRRSVITESDWDQQERLEALLDGLPPEEHTHTSASLQRLVERVLIVEQMSNLDFSRATPQEVEKYLANVRGQIPGAEGEAGWRALLAKYGLEDSELRQRVAEQLDMLKFINVKFRVGVRIPQEEADRYYRETFTAQMKAKNAAVPPLADVRGKIVALLTEQRVNTLLEDWVAGLKAEGAIQWMDGVNAAGQVKQ